MNQFSFQNAFTRISIAGMIAAATMLSSQAAIVNIDTTDPTAIANFQSGATVETFDTGLTGLAIENYDPVTVPDANQLSSRDIDDPNVPVFNSGGASFNDPKGNPGTLVGIFAPGGTIASEVNSSPNVIGPLILSTDDAFSQFSFLEVIFQNPVSKVGFEVTHGSLNLILKDINNSNLPDGEVPGTLGSFIGSDRGVAEIGGITILPTGTNLFFTLDDFTFGTSSTTPPTNNVPDAGSVWNFALAGVSLWLTRRKLSARQ